MGGFGAWNGRSELTTPAESTLTVHGEEDPSIAPSQAEPMLEGLPDAEMVTIPEAGHASNLERPAPVNDAIRSFLDERF